MLKFLLTAGVFVQFALTLKCHSCDSFLSCAQPFSVDCPSHSKCYILTKKNHQVISKGCAKSCENICPGKAFNCDMCSQRDLCNSHEHGIGAGVSVEHVDPKVPRAAPMSFHLTCGTKRLASASLIIFVYGFVKSW